MEQFESLLVGVRGLIGVHGVVIGAGASLIFYLLEVFFNLNRPDGKRTFGDNAKSAFLLVCAVGAMAGGVHSFYQNYEVKSQTTTAAEVVTAIYDQCRANVEAAPEAQKIAMVGEDVVARMTFDQERRVLWMLRHQCLALAIQSLKPGTETLTQSGLLARDVSFGARILSFAPDEEGSIADTLWRIYGVGTADFIGTGHTVPRPRPDSVSSYSTAVLREYWVPNTCVTTRLAPELCPNRNLSAFYWRFHNTDPVARQTVRELLLGFIPDDADATAYEELTRRLTTPDGVEGERGEAPLLVRFQIFSESRYKGQFGRVENQQVFFSSLEDSIDLPLAEAFRLSGESDPAAADPTSEPDTVSFVWVYMPQSMNQFRLATWTNLFLMLRNVRVSTELRALASQMPPPQAPN
ncbi:MAG: hypothetical protein NW206_12930 [Hyphomonadaceae bacterium]|nr:hypothetical protein [Hyphomonadaceae bacterium]